MGQPIPPGDLPLFEGLDSSWNDIVGAIPEDRRAELAPKLKERISGYEESLKPWQEFTKSGITPDHVSTALNTFSILENNPKQVYETIGNYLGITPAEAEAVVEAVEDGDQDDPRIQKMQMQLDTMAQVLIAQRKQTTQEQAAAEQDAAVDKEIKSVMQKLGDVPEDEILMRMLHKGMTAEQAHNEYTNRASEIRKTRPAPLVMGSGGHIPTNRAIDPVKLDNKGTKNLVAQMLDHANAQQNS